MLLDDLAGPSQPLRILDFDIENRPLTYLGSDYTTGDVTAIAWGWVGEEEVRCELQTKDERSLARMLRRFRDAYEEADMVTGHFIRGYDLPVLNGALMEMNIPHLGPKLTCDTKNDLLKRKYISASQENLAEMLGLPEPKIHMNTPRWRHANRLTPDGIELSRIRCVGDVVQHKALRLELVRRDWLAGPTVWRPGGGPDGDYVP
jgi:hypothetical protein